MAPSVLADPIFPNSVASNDLDFIQGTDPDAFVCFEYLGERTQEMPGHSSGDLMANGVFTYDALFSDGTSVEVWVHYDVQTEDAARGLVAALGPRLGKLPTFMRDPLRHVVIHAGDGAAFSEDIGQFFVLYEDNMAKRIANNDLEETVFHETVHATLDARYLDNEWWQSAQNADRDFITQYAADNPDKEDLAESALFAYAMLIHPTRLPETIELSIIQTMSARLDFFAVLFNENSPMFQQVGPAPDC